MNRLRTVGMLASIVSTLGSLSAGAAERSFLGAWTIVSAEPAPWADAPPDPVRSGRDPLTGRTVTFAAGRIVAPRPLACSKPNYAFKTYTPDMLFQGGLPDPGKQAAKLGFDGRAIQTLETGCDGALDFHFVGPDKAMFGLNNRIYVMTRTVR